MTAKSGRGRRRRITNRTLCFGQQEAAAVYAATKGSKSLVYVSPFIGRLDDGGENGVDLIKNIFGCLLGAPVKCWCWPPVFAIFSICFIHSMPAPNS